MTRRPLPPRRPATMLECSNTEVGSIAREDGELWVGRQGMRNFCGVGLPMETHGNRSVMSVPSTHEASGGGSFSFIIEWNGE
jgi:hypothetical protein